MQDYLPGRVVRGIAVDCFVRDAVICMYVYVYVYEVVNTCVSGSVGVISTIVYI